MSDLISREELMKLWDEYHPYIATRAIQFDQALRKLPSAYPKNGKWVELVDDRWGASHYFCSECGEEPLKEERTNRRCLSNFCPNCGARMVENS